MLPCSLTRWCNWHRGCGWGQMSSQVCGHKVGLVSQAWPDLLPPTWPRYWRFETEEEPWLFLPSPGTDAHHKEVNANCWDCVILTGPQLNFLFFDCVKRSDGTWVTEPFWEPPPMFGQISEVIFFEKINFLCFGRVKKLFEPQKPLLASPQKPNNLWVLQVSLGMPSKKNCREGDIGPFSFTPLPP